MRGNLVCFFIVMMIYATDAFGLSISGEILSPDPDTQYLLSSDVQGTGTLTIEGAGQGGEPFRFVVGEPSPSVVIYSECTTWYENSNASWNKTVSPPSGGSFERGVAAAKLVHIKSGPDTILDEVPIEFIEL